MGTYRMPWEKEMYGVDGTRIHIHSSSLLLPLSARLFFHGALVFRTFRTTKNTVFHLSFFYDETLTRGGSEDDLLLASASNSRPECSTCMDSTVDCLIVRCGHTFCWDCLKKRSEIPVHMNKFETSCFYCRTPYWVKARGTRALTPAIKKPH